MSHTAPGAAEACAASSAQDFSGNLEWKTTRIAPLELLSPINCIGELKPERTEERLWLKNEVQFGLITGKQKPCIDMLLQPVISESLYLAEQCHRRIRFVQMHLFPDCKGRVGIAQDLFEFRDRLFVA
ncbi:MAG: hypothetical protein ACLQAT_24380 [Candidatus Binataceae bacterium]